MGDIRKIKLSQSLIVLDCSLSHNHSRIQLISAAVHLSIDSGYTQRQQGVCTG